MPSMDLKVKRKRQVRRWRKGGGLIIGKDVAVFNIPCP